VSKSEQVRSPSGQPSSVRPPRRGGQHRRLRQPQLDIAEDDLRAQPRPGSSPSPRRAPAVHPQRPKPHRVLLHLATVTCAQHALSSRRAALPAASARPIIERWRFAVERWQSGQHLLEGNGEFADRHAARVVQRVATLRQIPSSPMPFASEMLPLSSPYHRELRHRPGGCRHPPASRIVREVSVDEGAEPRVGAFFRRATPIVRLSRRSVQPPSSGPRQYGPCRMSQAVGRQRRALAPRGGRGVQGRGRPVPNQGFTRARHTANARILMLWANYMRVDMSERDDAAGLEQLDRSPHLRGIHQRSLRRKTTAIYPMVSRSCSLRRPVR
jgi:hypothetical protein